MESPDVARAVDAAISMAVALDLPADDAVVLQNSNKLALRLLPCDVFARVAPAGHEHASLLATTHRKLKTLPSSSGLA